MPKLTPIQLGLIFLVPGLAVSVPALVSGHFQGLALGFGSFSVIFGGLMCLIGLVGKPQRS